MFKRKTFLLMFAIASIFGQTPKWNPRTELVWDVNGLLTNTQKTEIGELARTMPVTTRIVVVRDFSEESLGPEWFKKLPTTQASSAGYLAGQLINILCDEYKIGSEDKKGESLAILVTPLRGDPRKRWASSMGEKTKKKISLEMVSHAYQTFGETMVKQGDRLPARPETLTASVKAALAALQKK